MEYTTPITVTLTVEQAKDLIDLVEVASEDEIDFPDSVREAQSILLTALNECETIDALCAIAGA